MKHFSKGPVVRRGDGKHIQKSWISYPSLNSEWDDRRNRNRFHPWKELWRPNDGGFWRLGSMGWALQATGSYWVFYMESALNRCVHGWQCVRQECVSWMPCPGAGRPLGWPWPWWLAPSSIEARVFGFSLKTESIILLLRWFHDNKLDIYIQMWSFPSHWHLSSRAVNWGSYRDSQLLPFTAGMEQLGSWKAWELSVTLNDFSHHASVKAYTGIPRRYGGCSSRPLQLSGYLNIKQIIIFSLVGVLPSMNKKCNLWDV